MKIFFAKKFRKNYNRLDIRIREQCDERLRLFASEPFHPLLNNHSVEKRFPDCRSINVTGDYRAIFKQQNGVVVFVNIGTHSELYS
ncbi:MAG: type II toxin-antitoxin system YafQ family toxin [Patescibacteria group bacterium]